MCLLDPTPKNIISILSHIGVKIFKGKDKANQEYDKKYWVQFLWAMIFNPLTFSLVLKVSVSYFKYQVIESIYLEDVVRGLDVSIVAEFFSWF